MKIKEYLNEIRLSPKPVKDVESGQIWKLVATGEKVKTTGYSKTKANRIYYRVEFLEGVDKGVVEYHPVVSMKRIK